MNRRAYIIIGVLGVALMLGLGAAAASAWLQPGSSAEPAASARLGAWYNVNGMAWQLRPNGELIITGRHLGRTRNPRPDQWGWS